MTVNAGAPNAISCEDLWMVFGENAATKLADLRSASVEETAAALQSEGLIPAVRGVSFDVREGELFVVMGLSGSGKSTVIRCLSRLLEPSAGSVLISGEDIIAAPKKRMVELRREKIGMVFQHFGLFPHMTVAENVAFPLKVQGGGKAERLARAHEMIELVGLGGREEAYPRQLSGGQQQRVGIARSLAVNPDIWFLDEPFSALDPLIRRQLQDEFLRIQSELEKSIVFITHDISEALKLADRIAIMRDGVIEQLGTPAEIVLNPVNDYVAEFARDIPRGKMMKIEAIMTPLNGSSIDQNSENDTANLRASMSLEVALAAFVDGHADMPVRDGDGKLVGKLTPGNLVRALVTEAS